MKKHFKPEVTRLEDKKIPSGIFWSPTLTPTVEYGGAGEIGSWQNPNNVPPITSVDG